MGGALRFEVLARSASTKARVGRVTTAHGSFDTPAFMPVGTRGTVRGLLPHLVAQTGAQIILGNTYHLLLRPGPEAVERLGGLHRFTGWPGPMLTDSGGFQAFSMADINAVDDDGVTFRSIVDGSVVRLTPERAIEVQNTLGADIIMAFDDCPPAAGGDGVERPGAGAHADRLRVANERTVRWLERCARAHGRPDDQALFGIVQGGTDFDLRRRSVEGVCGVDLPGYAIGGVAVGESPDEIARVTAFTAPLLPEGKPRYLMGVGYERDLVAAIRAGVDMFDCVLPTRNGRNANAFTRAGPLRLRNAKFAEDPGPIEDDCDCAACRPAGDGPPGPFSRGYLRHLFQAEEMLGPILVSLHNLRYFQRLMSDVRRTVRDDDWRGFLARWPRASPDVPRDEVEGASAGAPADHTHDD
ncbi:MAG: tRNA guanosine(34) transglycosylase Tgt [Phycisphaerales bacterium]